MSRGPHPAAVSRLATAASGLGDEGWVRELEALGADRADGGGVPTYEELAAAGVAAVEALAGAGRWDAAAAQSDRLTAFFRAHRDHIHPVAAESFDGLRAAVRARDPEEVGDFLDLLRELFPAAGG